MKNPTISLLFAATLPTTVFGLGFRLTDQDPVATARGGAFVATADNPSAVYYNPAGITQLEGTRSLMGVYGISYESSFDPKGPGNAIDTKWSPEAVPHSFYTLQPKNSQLTLGLGMYSPFGLGFEWDDGAPFRTLAKKGEIQYICVNPVAAWKFNDQLSIGAGPTFNYSRAKLTRGIVTSGDEFKFSGAGVGFGFTAGVLWKPTEQHAFGASYHGASSIDYSGHTRVRIPGFKVPGGKVPRFESEDDANAKLQFPQTITAGYSFRPTPDWNFEFDIEWTDWDYLNTVTLAQSKGADLKIPFNYSSSFLYDFGVTRKFSNGMRLSAGYIYSENSVPNEYYNPLVPDSDRHVFSLGLGRSTGKISWDIAYQYAFSPDRKISNGTAANGTYHFQSNALTVSLGYKF